MRIMNRTQSQKIDTALPSDVPCQRNVNPALDCAHRSEVSQAAIPVRNGRRICTLCGTDMGFRFVGPMRMPEFILSCLCILLWIAVVAFLGYLLVLRVERGFEHLFGGWMWHEPVDDWNL